MNKKIKSEFGFTLVELMVTLAVAAILLTVAVPSFTDLIRSNRLTTKTNLFTTALNLARSEAVKRNVKVVVCKGASGACNTGDNWEDGWTVFADEDNDGAVDAGEAIRVFEALSGAYSLRSNAGSINNSIVYLPSGRAVGGGGALPIGSYNLCASDAASDMTNRSRRIAVSASGRVRLEMGATACP